MHVYVDSEMQYVIIHLDQQHKPHNLHATFFNNAKKQKCTVLIEFYFLSTYRQDQQQL